LTEGKRSQGDQTENDSSQFSLYPVSGGQISLPCLHWSGSGGVVVSFWNIVVALFVSNLCNSCQVLSQHDSKIVLHAATTWLNRKRRHH